MPDERKRTAERAVVPVSLPPSVIRLIGRAAAKRHKTRSAFLRDAAVAEANRILGIEPDTDAAATAA